MPSNQTNLKIVTDYAMRDPTLISDQIHKKQNGVEQIGIAKKNKFIIENEKLHLENYEGKKYKKWEIIIEGSYVYIGKETNDPKKGHCYDLDKFINFLRGDLKKIECIPDKSYGRPGGEKLRGTSRFLVRN